MPAKQDDLPGLPLTFWRVELPQHAIEHGEPGLDAIRIESQFVQQLQLRAAGMECEPIVLVLCDGFFVGLGARSRRAHENFQRSEERRVGKECRSRWSPY